MPRYESSGWFSKAFWAITLDGQFIKTSTGRMGSAERSTVETIGPIEEAKREHDALIAQKLKGHVQGWG